MKEDKIIVQSNDLIRARYDFTATEMNIFFMLLSQLGKNDEKGRLYRIRVMDIQNKTGSKIKYEQLREATRQLRMREYEIVKENGNVLQIGILASAEYIKGTGTIELELSEKIKPYLFDLKQNFTAFQLYMALAVKSKFSKRFYQILSSYKDTKNFSIRVEDLKNKLGLIDKKTGSEKYTKWSMFESKVLKVAEKELKTHTDINFSYSAQKTGRKYTHLTFKIQHKPIKLPVEKFQYLTDDSELKERLIKDNNLAEWQANKVLKNFNTNEIRRELRKIHIMHLDGEIKNIGAYTAQTFERLKPNLGIFK